MIRINPNKIKLFFLVYFSVVSTAMCLGVIKGKVVTEQGKPIPYAVVKLADGSTTIANSEGEFSLPDTLLDAEIQVSAIGYESLRLRLTGRERELNLSLKESMSHLSEVVITGNFEPQSARQSVYQVRSIDKTTIQNRAATNIQEVLNTELGVRFSQDNALGSSNLEMMGMSGQNVKILIDGIPMVGRQGVSNEININQIDINQIEKIEIIEGPMSVIYGADALAGVINIITKNPQHKPGYSLHARLQEETVGDSYSPLSNAGNHIRSINGGYTLAQAWRFGGGYTQNRFGGWKGHHTGRQFDWLPRDQDLLRASVGFYHNQLELDYSLDYLNEKIFSFGPENRVEFIDSEYHTNRWMHRLQGRYDFSSAFKLSLQSSFTDYSRETITWVTNARTSERSLSNAPESQARIDYTGVTVRAMAMWVVSPRLNLQPGIDINTERGSGERIAGNEGIQDYAAFLTGEWSPIPQVKIRPGIRRAYNSAYEAPPIIPSLNTRFELSQHVDVKLAYAKGFRAPSIRELYFDFFDASHSITGNTDLRAETSDSFNGSINFNYKVSSMGSLTTSVRGFYNDVNDQIAYGIDPNDPRITTLFNVERFRTAGVMFNQSLRSDGWSAEIGLSRIGRYNALANSEHDLPEMIYTTELNTNVNYHLKAINTHFNLYYKWTGALPAFELASDENGEAVPRQIRLEGFHWMDLTVRKPLGDSFSVSLGARNLLDVKRIQSTTSEGGAHGGGSLRPVGYGRSYFLGITYQLAK